MPLGSTLLSGKRAMIDIYNSFVLLSSTLYTGYSLPHSPYPIAYSVFNAFLKLNVWIVIL